jgi:pyruvate-ferredoxin/flavodoxin oxidoreductase
MKFGLNQQKLAVDSGYWPLFRFDPQKMDAGENPFQLDSKAPKIPLEEYAYNEMRYLMLSKAKPDIAKDLMKKAQKEVEDQWQVYEKMVSVYEPNGKTEEE